MYVTYRSGHVFRGFQCNKAGDTSSAGRTPWEAVVHADSNRRKHPKAGGRFGGHGGLNARVGTQWEKWRGKRRKVGLVDCWNGVLNAWQLVKSQRGQRRVYQYSLKGAWSAFAERDINFIQVCLPQSHKEQYNCTILHNSCCPWLDGDGMTNRLKLCCVI